MSKDITLRLPKVVVFLDVPDATTHQHIMDEFADDGTLAWLKQQVRDRKPASVTINSWRWAVKTSMGRSDGGEPE